MMIDRIALVELNGIREERERLEIRLRELLEKRGWEWTSSTPGCIWLFRKKVNGETILVDAGMAENMERDVCEINVPEELEV